MEQPHWEYNRSTRDPKHGFRPLGTADGFVKSTIFGFNSARLFNMNLRAETETLSRDRMAALKRDFAAVEGMRNNATYGFVAPG